MMKVFYYPTYFKLRKLGETKALVLATLFVFVVTWFLHSYQWFWLRGSFPVIWQDAVFWRILARSRGRELAVRDEVRPEASAGDRSAANGLEPSPTVLKTRGVFTVDRRPLVALDQRKFLRRGFLSGHR